MKSVMSHKFSEVPRVEMPRSSFDRSHGVKCTFDAGYLVPIYVDEALPGDTFNFSSANLIRLISALDVPVMDNLFCDTFYFSVPLRLVWDNFQKMMGEQTDPGDSTDYIVPTVTAGGGGHAVGSLYDYLGLPTEIASIEHSNLFARAYNLVWNEWFRDQNMQDSVVVDRDDGPDTVTDYVLKKRGKRHDYFTSCLPWPQKGTAVDLPIGAAAPVIGIGIDNTPVAAGSFSLRETGASSPRSITGWGTEDIIVEQGPVSGYPGIYADLSNATAATINQLRQAFQIQRMYEIDARSGTRYTEIIRGHFGVVSPDARLQRPEFLGGSSQRVDIQQVATTASFTYATGTLGAYAISGSPKGGGFVHSFTEHCIVIGLCSVRADLTYQQGMHRMFSRQDKLDFYWPSLSQIGEQAVLNKEIYTQGTAADEDVFGYQERFAEYRYKPSTIHGQLRSTFATTLDIWHFSQEFGGLPTLDDTFISEDPPIDRALAVTAGPQFVGDFYHKLICARPMPLYGVPAGIGRF